MLKRTPFYKKHLEAGGKIIPFAGFEMPIQYKGIINEVKRVRTTVGMFDVSHMGRVEISGPEALEFISQITTNDPSKLENFQAQYSCMCHPDGGIVDDILVYRLPDKFLLVINAGNKDKDLNWMVEHKLKGANIKDVSDEMAQLAIQGPKAESVVQKLSDINLREIKFYWSADCEIAGVQTFISRTGYTGEDGFELYFPNNYANKVWDAIFEAGKEFELEPVGLGSRDTLRLEMKYCLYGNDIDKTTTPLEAGLGWITKFDKKDFIGKSALLKQKEEGLKRKLTAFIMKSKAIPRHHYKIFGLPVSPSQGGEGNQIGEVTSGNFSPSINKCIGLGYINIPYNKIDTEIEIECRGKIEKAIIIKPPFYKNATHK
ncbi:glycine cleavage system aminomethyltransferase GcvT [candidate division WOR-3 bacterium]|nr:glycine cleavage system aminomethyltransferase GcvT [candidate division WOR-3 bacterium]